MNFMGGMNAGGNQFNTNAFGGGMGGMNQQQQ